jgi:hypothetical protein
MSGLTQRPVDLSPCSQAVHLHGTRSGDNGPEEVAMTKIGRNEPCSCGSGSKAKRCCYGPVGYVDVRIMPLEVYRDSIAELAGTTREEFDALFAELVDLPELNLTLQVPLPSIWTSRLDRVVIALQDDDTEEFNDALNDVLGELDTIRQRLLLARAVVILRDAGQISKRLAAFAVIELDREYSAFFASSVAESLAVVARHQLTPSSLEVATA